MIIHKIFFYSILATLTNNNQFFRRSLDELEKGKTIIFFQSIHIIFLNLYIILKH